MKNSKADILWSFQYNLGRAPESPDVTSYFYGVEDLGGTIYASSERVKKGLSYFRPDEFCVWRPGKPKIVILSSCQGPALARAMSTIADVSVFGGAVIKTRNPDFAGQLLGLMNTADHILIADFTENWAPFSAEILRQTYGDKVKTYHRPFFEGIHPDQSYADPAGGQSPVSDYHSRLVIHSYQNGLTEAECLARFNPDEYRRVGFVEIANRSIAKLAEKDAKVDVKIGDYILENMKDKPLFYTINHPTQVLQLEIARRYLEQLGIPTRKVEPLLIPTVLSQGPIWPVDAAWAEVMGLNYNTGDAYWHGQYMMSREEFIHRSYWMYSSANQSALSQATAALKA